jgi:hypothetical protein
MTGVEPCRFATAQTEGHGHDGDRDCVPDREPSSRHLGEM